MSKKIIHILSESLVKIIFPFIRRHFIILIGLLINAYMIFLIFNIAATLLITFILLFLLNQDDKENEEKFKNVLTKKFERCLNDEFEPLYYEYNAQGGESPFEADFVLFVEKEELFKLEAPCIKIVQELYKGLLNSWREE